MDYYQSVFRTAGMTAVRSFLTERIDPDAEYQRKQDGHHACKKTDHHHVAAHDGVDAGAGPIQCRGQYVCRAALGGCPDGSHPGLPHAEYADLFRGRNGRRYQCPPVQVTGREAV